MLSTLRINSAKCISSLICRSNLAIEPDTLPHTSAAHIRVRSRIKKNKCILRTMSRPLRLEFPNTLYHVTSRGDRREAIYEDDDDRLRFLEIFGTVVVDYNWLCPTQRSQNGDHCCLQNRCIQPARNRRVLSIAPNDNRGYCSQE